MMAIWAVETGIRISLRSMPSAVKKPCALPINKYALQIVLLGTAMRKSSRGKALLPLKKSARRTISPGTLPPPRRSLLSIRAASGQIFAELLEHGLLELRAGSRDVRKILEPFVRAASVDDRARAESFFALRN